MKVALAQLNPTIGDFAGNVERGVAAAEQARARGAELVVFPELYLCGYPPRDLCEREAFVADTLRALDGFARALPVAAVVGFIDRNPRPEGRPIHNAAAVVEGGRVVSVHHKALLPTYDVFDEHRHFEPAGELRVASLAGRRVAVTICEDAWSDPEVWSPRYRRDPLAELGAQGAELIVNLSASPFTLDKRALRPRLFGRQARRHRLPIALCNQVGGQDELIFDGASAAFGADGACFARAAEFREDLVIADFGARTGDAREPAGDDDAAAIAALALGVADYARRCSFARALVGVSGGIDSAVTAAIAARALGPDRVRGVAMPGRYSSPRSLADARALCANLGIALDVIPIEGPYAALLEALAPAFAGRAPDVTEENLQARVRGTLLMALSNKLGELLLTTGNKSELATGYCTLYGDLCGGLAVLADVPKRMVCRLAEALNRGRELVPRSTLERAPTAELREHQTDQDTLPPYPLLDAILEAHVERGLDRAALREAGLDGATADAVVAMVRRAEYKRRQMPPGLKLTTKAFGIGRRMPIAHAWRG